MLADGQGGQCGWSRSWGEGLGRERAGGWAITTTLASSASHVEPVDGEQRGDSLLGRVSPTD